MGIPYRGAAGLLGIGVPATSVSSYATGISATNVFHVDGFGEGNDATTYDRRITASGYEEGLGITATAATKRVSFGGPLCDTSFPILWALALGTDTISTIAASTGRQHLTTPVALSAELPQTSLYFKHTPAADTSSIGSIAYHGCILDSLTVSGEAGGIWRYQATFCTSGIGVTNATDVSALTKPNVLPFRFSGSQFSVSSTTPTVVAPDPGTASTSISTGTGWTFTDLKAYLRSQTWTVNNNCQQILTAGSSSATITVRGTRTTTVSSTLLFDNTAPVRTWPYSIDGDSLLTHGLVTRSVSSSAAGTSCNYGFQIQVPKATASSVDVAKTLGTRELTIAHTVVDSGAGLYTIYATGWNVATAAYTP